jgi:transposase
MIFKTRDLLVRQRTQTINAVRGHLTEHGIIAPQGTAYLGRLTQALADAEGRLLVPVAALCKLLIANVASLTEQSTVLHQQIRAHARRSATACRLMTIPDVGLVCAMAMAALAPPPETFAKGRNFAAWLGLTPKQNSSGGKDRLGRTSKMGQRDVRRLLILGATSVARKGAPEGSWLARMLARKPRLLIAVALANHMARVAWALMAKTDVYRAEAAAA